MTLVEVALIILILSASALCVFAIIYLKTVIRQIDEMKNDIHLLVSKSLPLIESLDETAKRADRIVSGLENYWVELESSIRNLRTRISDFSPFKSGASSENSISDFIKNLRAFSKGFTSFWNAFKNR